MIDWVRAHQWMMWSLVAISIITFVTSIVAVPWMLVRIPPHYFLTTKHEHPWRDRHPIIRVVLLAAKNLLGLVLVALGVLMLVLPGQGILTIVGGLVLVDFPGKHRLLLWLISRQTVLKAVNWVRAKSGHEPLVVPVVASDYTF